MCFEFTGDTGGWFYDIFRVMVPGLEQQNDTENFKLYEYHRDL